MPGMAANSTIFENIVLPSNFIVHYLEWVIPYKDETIADYSKRLLENVKHENPVLIGVSFGGIMVQEMAKHIQVKKVIIISSIKSNQELPKRMIFAKYTKAYKILPTSIINNVEMLAKYAFGNNVTKRLKLYEKYLSIRDKYYLDWSLSQIINWKQKVSNPDIIHIHGDKDPVFPINHIKTCIVVKDGTHIMIINKFKWFNENLPAIILS
jgi:esterase/lipase